MKEIGYKDRKGKEVCVGDIIKHCLHDKDKEQFPHGVVCFEDGRFGIRWGTGDFLTSVLWNYHFIIGTIYENPVKEDMQSCNRIFNKISREAWEKGSLKKEESMRSCEGCKHKPKEGELYYAPCGECGRFYYDHFEKKEGR